MGEPNLEYALGISFMTSLQKKPIFISYIILWLALGFALVEKFQIALLVIFLSITIMIVYEILYKILNLEKSIPSFLSFHSIYSPFLSSFASCPFFPPFLFFL